MKRKNTIAFTAVMVMVLSLLSCTNSPPSVETVEQENDVTIQEIDPAPQESTTASSESTGTSQENDKSSGEIYLYGERHAVKSMKDEQIKLWDDYYNNQGMRHLFIEYPYYTGEFMNIWMQSDSDEILDEIYGDWAGSPAQHPSVKEFFETIKRQYPETIFHGTDVGHQYETTGKRFLEYLESNNLEASDQYSIAKDVIDQGELFYANRSFTYRENMMVENFIREFDKLEGESIMGIYGGAHVAVEEKEQANFPECMSNQLRERYESKVNLKSLTDYTKADEPIRVDRITVGGKEYEASYFGKRDMTGFKDNKHFEFWRLENAYDDFCENEKDGDVLPYNNFPMAIEAGQVLILGITKTDDSFEQVFYRSDGNEWNGMKTTEGFIVE